MLTETLVFAAEMLSMERSKLYVNSYARFVAIDAQCMVVDAVIKTILASLSSSW